jgi:hypothetical protein
VEGIDAPVVHFVCHSLGGLLVRHLFHDFPDQRPGRVVTLGTPHGTSGVATQLAHPRWSRWVLGASIEQGLTGGVPPWRATNRLGVIAGDRGIGVGRLLTRASQPSDGTVAVHETRAERMDDHLVLPVSHSSMLFSSRVAVQVLLFLDSGHFDPPRRSSRPRGGAD